MKQRWARILLYAVLVGWCLLFLRCETTEKSMIRVVYLEQKEQTWSVGLLYQSPEAAADAADASAALRIADGRGQSWKQPLPPPKQPCRRRQIIVCAIMYCSRSRRRMPCWQLMRIWCWNAAAGAQRPTFLHGI